MALIDRIKFEGQPDVLVWKWHSDKGKSDEIRLGAQLIVNESQEALFFKGGQALDLFSPGTHTLASGNLPILSKLINLPFGGKTPFAAEVYYISKTVSSAQDWGTKTPVMVLDPRYRVTVPLRGYGSYAIRIANAREFVVQIVGTSQGSAAHNVALSLLASPIASCMQQGFGDYMVQKKVSVLELPAHTLELGEYVASLLQTRYKTFGVELINLAIESINFDPNDSSVKALRERLDKQADLEQLGDAKRRNIDIYRMDRQFDVLESAAEHHDSTGEMLGSMMGVGMGFGMAGAAGQIAKEAMKPAPVNAPVCPHCGQAHPAGMKFCPTTGAKLTGELVPCPHCKAENTPTAKFCVDCGGAMQVPKCPVCKNPTKEDDKFCPHCGNKQSRTA